MHSPLPCEPERQRRTAAQSGPVPAAGDGGQISDREFERFRELIGTIAGIRLASSKKALVCGRLAKRLRERNLGGYGEYYKLVTSVGESRELEICINLLTTNETYFFREGRHFDLLKQRVLPQLRGRNCRIWSAACSSGEEPYTLAMVAAEALGDGDWEVLGTDIGTHVLQRAARGHYPVERAREVPQDLLRKYCLKGVGGQEGTILVNEALRRRVRFGQVNLNRPLPSAVGEFDIVFLRNVMIYFDADIKRAVVSRILRQLKPEGWLFVGHSESLNGFSDEVRAVAPSVYRKV